MPEELMVSSQNIEVMHKQPVAAVSGARLIGLFAGIELALFLSALDQTILNAAVPKLSTQLGAFDRGPWIITAYLLTSAIITPVAGKLADIVGTKRALLWASMLFTLGSVLCGSAGMVENLAGMDAMAQLVAARLVQGLGGGGMIALCFISVGELFAARERGKYQGILAAAFIVAALIGPALGGLLADKNLWRAIFYINVPLGLIAIACLQAFFPHSARELRTGPLIPLHMFKSLLINICLTTVFVSGIGLFGGSLVLAVLMQNIFHTSAAQSGYALTPLMLVVAGASIASGLIISKTGRYKMLCIAGLLFMTAGTMLLATVNASTTLTAVLVDAGVAGVGLGLLLPVHAIVVQSSVQGAVLGFATSMTQLFRSLGGTIGTAILSALLVALLQSHSMQSALVVIFIIYGVTTAATLVLNFFLPEIELKGTL